MSVTEISQRHALILDAVSRLLRRGAVRNLAKMVNKMLPVEVSKLVRHLDTLEDQCRVVGLVEDVTDKAHVISELYDDAKIGVFTALSSDEQNAILQHLSSDDAADLLGLLPEELSAELILQLPADDVDDVVDLLRYPEETAGGIMTPEFLALPPTTSAKEAIATLRADTDAEMVFYIYVVDEDGVLGGVLSLRDLLAEEPDTPLDAFMTSPVVSARVDMDQEETARLTARYNLLALPVVDLDERLVGIITVDDVIDVMRDEATEDMLRMSGTRVDEDYTVSMSSMRAVRLRLPWLMVNVLGGLASAWVLSQFTTTLESLLALASFIPISMALGGSLGVQSSTIMVAGLATGRIEWGDVRRVFMREMRVGAMVGLLSGVIVGACATFWHDPWLGMVVGVSLFAACGVAAVSGTLIPLVFHRVRIDPAISSGPLVTMLNDLSGLIIYLGFATLLLHYRDLLPLT